MFLMSGSSRQGHDVVFCYMEQHGTAYQNSIFSNLQSARKLWLTHSQSTVVFRESVRKNAIDCFEKKGFARNRHLQGTANFGYLEAI